jgi:alpha-mannosidase
MKLGNSNIPTLDTTTPQISVLAGGQVDGTSLGIPDQDGDTYFLQRFALTTHTGYDPAQAMRFALEHQNPLVAGTVNGGTVYPPDIFSLLSVDDPNVLLWVLKPAEDGVKSGVIARLWNMSANPASIALSCPPFPFLKAMQLTHLETPTDQISLENGVLKTALNQFQLKTFSLYPSAPAFTPRSWLPLISDNK